MALAPSLQLDVTWLWGWPASSWTMISVLRFTCVLELEDTVASQVTVKLTPPRHLFACAFALYFLFAIVLAIGSSSQMPNVINSLLTLKFFALTDRKTECNQLRHFPSLSTYFVTTVSNTKLLTLLALGTTRGICWLTDLQ